MSLGTNYNAYVGASPAAITNTNTGDLISVAYQVARIGDPLSAYSTEIEAIKTSPETKNLVSLDTDSIKASNLTFATTANIGLIVNNLTTAQRTALPNTPGAIVYDADTTLFYTNDGTSWSTIGAGGGGGDFSNGGDVAGANRTLGNTDAFSLALLTGGVERLQIAATGATNFTNSLTFSGTTNNGLVVNNLTTAERTALANTAGNIVFDTTLANLQVNDGTAWTAIGSGGGGGDFSNGGEAGTANRTLGNTDAFALALLTNNVERVQVAATGETTFTNNVQFTGTTHGGLILNSLTTTEANAIASPVDGTMIFNSTIQDVQVFHSSQFRAIEGHYSNTGDTTGGSRLLGSNDAFPIDLITDATSRIRLQGASSQIGFGTTTPQETYHFHDGSVGITATAAPHIKLAPGAESQSGVDAVRVFYGLATGSNNFVNGAVANDLVVRGRIDGRVLLAQGQSILNAEFSMADIIFNAPLSFGLTTHAGLRLNRLSTAQQAALPAPAAGDYLWESTIGERQFHDGTNWHSADEALSYGLFSFVNQGANVMTNPGVGTPSHITNGTNDLWVAHASNTGITVAGDIFTFTVGGLYECHFNFSGSKDVGGGNLEYEILLEVNGAIDNTAKSSSIVNAAAIESPGFVTFFTIAVGQTVRAMFQAIAGADDLESHQGSISFRRIGA